MINFIPRSIVQKFHSLHFLSTKAVLLFKNYLEESIWSILRFENISFFDHFKTWKSRCWTVNILEVLIEMIDMKNCGLPIVACKQRVAWGIMATLMLCICCLMHADHRLSHKTFTFTLKLMISQMLLYHALFLKYFTYSDIHVK